MRIRTDDEVYRVDSVWLGPPKATLPWRTRYVSWGVGTVLFLVVLGVERQVGIGFGFFSTAWALLITILITRLVGSRITHERPLTSVFLMWARELATPRQCTTGTGGAASVAQVHTNLTRPRPRPRACPVPGEPTTGRTRSVVTAVYRKLRNVMSRNGQTCTICHRPVDLKLKHITVTRNVEVTRWGSTTVHVAETISYTHLECDSSLGATGQTGGGNTHYSA